MKGAIKPPVTVDEDGNPQSGLANEVFAFYKLAESADKDPAALGFPPLLPIEIVLQTAPLRDICTSYGVDRDTFEVLKTDPLFVDAVRRAREMAKKDGWSFKMKALMQAEALLASSWTLIHAPDVPASVKKDLILGTWRAAGVAEPEQKNAGQQNAFQININLGG